MLCKNPYPRGVHLFPCGQCMPCRFNRRRTWAHRIMLEAAQYEDNAFVTLSYADENLPLLTCTEEVIRRSDAGYDANGSALLPNLMPSDLTLWLKRIRQAFWTRTERTLRYYAVGEYGDETLRPHYHVALFGFPACAFGKTVYRKSGRCCFACDFVSDTWGLGRIEVGTLTLHSAQYVAGYVTKKMTKKDDARLDGRYPEFSRMSRRPGIGAGFMHEVASELLKLEEFEKLVDVPMALRHGPRSLPLGRYLRGVLRELIGRDKKAPPEVLEAMAAELRDLYNSTGDDETGHDPEKYKSAALSHFRQKVLQFETKAKIFNQRKDKL